MSKRNRLDQKKLRRELRAAKDELNVATFNAQPAAKFGICAVTGKNTIVDHEYSISQPAWFEIRYYLEKSKK